MVPKTPKKIFWGSSGGKCTWFDDPAAQHTRPPRQPPKGAKNGRFGPEIVKKRQKMAKITEKTTKMTLFGPKKTKTK